GRVRVGTDRTDRTDRADETDGARSNWHRSSPPSLTVTCLSIFPINPIRPISPIRPAVSLSSVLFLFLTHLGVGIVVTLLSVSREAGVKFFRFNAGLAAILLVIAIAFYLQSVQPAVSGVTARAGAGAIRVAAAPYLLPLLLSTGLTVFAWATIGRLFTKFRPAILAAAAATGVVAIVMQALQSSGGASSALQALTVVSFLTSSLLLGGACTAMILGHWYLVIPSME